VTIALEVRAAHAGDVMALHLLLSSAFAEYEGKLDPPSGAHDETPDSMRASSVKEARLSAASATRPSDVSFTRRKTITCNAGYTRPTFVETKKRL